jgi:hypothetical protein
VPHSDSLGLTEDELAARAGVSLERVKRLAKLGVVQASETDGTFRVIVVQRIRIDVQRIRIAEAFVDSGLAVEDLGRLVAEGHVTFPNREVVFGEPIAASDTTFADFASHSQLYEMGALWLPLSKVAEEPIGKTARVCECEQMPA